MTGFEIAFLPGASLHGWAGDADLSPADDGYEVLVMEACGLLGEVDGAEFLLGGFGRGRWPVDVSYDMSAFVESLPALVEAVRASAAIDVDIYSQGIECTLGFRAAGDDVEISCSSRTSWVPDPQHERISRELLLDMLQRFAKSLADGLSAVAPSLVAVEPFDRWYRGEL